MSDFRDPKCVDCQRPIPAVVPMLDRPPHRCQGCENLAHPPTRAKMLDKVPIALDESQPYIPPVTKDNHTPLGWRP